MRFREMTLLLLAGAAVGVLTQVPARRLAVAQQPTGSIPTVTGTPTGPTVAVDPSLERVRVYSGPSSLNYPAIGVLLTGVRAPALGRALGNDDWILIRYDGVPGSQAWIYALYVSLSGSGGQELPRVEVPATPTPASTPTIDPTLAAAFIPPENATRLPTFTAVPPLAIPTFVDEAGAASRIPVGLLILGFAVIGALGTMISFLRGR
ncbi:MAG: hypothetical protein V1755_04110 [Chloroflexota bacterium]